MNRSAFAGQEAGSSRAVGIIRRIGGSLKLRELSRILSDVPLPGAVAVVADHAGWYERDRASAPFGQIIRPFQSPQDFNI